MKLVLKILALPVLFVVKVICILGNLLTNVVSYVIGILLLVIGGSWNCDNSSGFSARLGCYESREYSRKFGSIYQVVRNY